MGPVALRVRRAGHRGAGDGQPEPLAADRSWWSRAASTRWCPGSTRSATLDLSNITITEGDDGIVVFDPLISTETARAALDLYYAHRPHKPVVALDLLPQPRRPLRRRARHRRRGGRARRQGQDRARRSASWRRRWPRTCCAGNVMSRRVQLHVRQPAARRPQGPGRGRSRRDAPRPARSALIPPTDHVTETGQRMTIDGLDLRVHARPGLRGAGGDALVHRAVQARSRRRRTAATRCTTPIRSAARRSAIRCAWSKYLKQTIDDVGRPGRGDVRACTTGRRGGATGCSSCSGWQRDGYRFINDETLRLANHGLTPSEIAEQVVFPPALDRHWAKRGYYGTLNHNVKATYVNYLGWFDGNPATLHTLPPVEAARRYVEFMGGAERRWTRRAGRSSWATTAGSRRSSTTSSSPTRTTRPPATCRPTRSSSSATSPSPARGATST